MKKRKKKLNLDEFQNIIKKHKKDLPIYFDTDIIDIKNNFWFDIQKSNSLTNHNNINFNANYDTNKNKIINSIKIKIKPNLIQKKILDKWFVASTEMYNQTLKYVRNNYKFTKKDIIIEDIIRENNKKNKNYYNFYYLRSKLKPIRDVIISKTQIDSLNTKIYTHILDATIKQFTDNIKIARQNIINGNIKKFKMKYWKNDRPSQTLSIEKAYIKDNKICYDRLGDLNLFYNNKKIKPAKKTDIINIDNILTNNLLYIDKTIKINYNNITKEYSILIPKEIETVKINNKENNMISLDPGLRTFMTGISENGNIKIGNNVNKYISDKLKRYRKILKNSEIPNKIKIKNEKIINKKIYNMIDDLHWKTIKYLTHNYETILMGDMSAQKIVNSENSKLSKITKVACLRTRFYDFYLRLKYKCELYKINFKLVDESYTSKCCSYCGNIKDNLGDSKIYICNKCNKILDRDINGARNIYFKNLL